VVDFDYISEYIYVVNLLEENEIKFKFNKLKYIKSVFLPGAHGMYNRKFKGIYIETGLWKSDWYMIQGDVRIAVLAHEMAHSQRISHNKDTTSLMCDKVDLHLSHLIKTKGIDSLIIDAFRLKRINH